jgi:hypothetical protein
MTPLRAHAAGAFKWACRRDFLIMAASAVAMKVADVALDKMVVDPLLEEPVRDPFVSTVVPMVMLAAYGHARQKAALARWQAGGDVVASLPEIDAEKRHAVLDFSGDRARYAAVGEGLSVFAGDVVGRPVVEAPDPVYGRFVYYRAAAVAESRAPALMSCAGQIGGRTVRYLSLMLPTGRGVVSIGYPESEWPTAARPVSARPNGGPQSLGISATI